MADKSAFMNIRVPAVLHRAFKLSCILRGTTMQDQLIFLMKCWVVHHEDTPFVKSAFVSALKTTRPEKAAKERKP